MTPNDPKKAIRESIVVGRADIAAAKAFLVSATGRNTSALLKQWLAENKAGYPKPVPVRGGNVDDDDLRKTARTLSLTLAGVYAVWELINTGCLLPASELHEETFTVDYTSESHDGGWHFEDLRFSYPARVIKPLESASRGVLTDGDLYLHQLGLPDLHSGIEAALREAARCFRYDLFTGAAAMLGAASEGIWIELGRSLVKACPASSQSERVRKTLDTSSRGIGYLVKQIVELCESQQAAGGILKQAGVTLTDLRIAAHWWDTVRDARNVLHWGVDPSLPNNFDKVSVLMLSGASHLRALWSIRTAALAARPSPGP